MKSLLQQESVKRSSSLVSISQVLALAGSIFIESSQLKFSSQSSRVDSSSSQVPTLVAQSPYLSGVLVN